MSRENEKHWRKSFFGVNHEGRNNTDSLSLAKKLNFTNKELSALAWIMIHGTAFPTSEIVEKRSQMVNVPGVLGMSSVGVLAVHLKQGEHVKQGIVELDDGFTKDFSEVGIKMPCEVMIALSGGKLNSEQMLSIDNTALAEILVEKTEVLKINNNNKRRRIIRMRKRTNSRKRRLRKESRRK